MTNNKKVNSTFTKKRINLAEVTRLQKLLRAAHLNTVCEGAQCPNIGECFHKKIATFLIAGTVCTRGCKFCAIAKGKPQQLDPDEPGRVAAAIKELGLRYAVVTSVTRDDLPDGAAEHFARTIRSIRALTPEVKIEVLVPDFQGTPGSLRIVADTKPDVFSHNLETVPRLYPVARQGGDYKRSLDVLRQAKQMLPLVKSGIMLGLGESEADVLAVLKDLRAVNCDFLTLGQYLAPSTSHVPIQEYISDDTFAHYKTLALDLGFKHCASGSYVRSSYRADEALLTED